MPSLAIARVVANGRSSVDSAGNPPVIHQPSPYFLSMMFAVLQIWIGYASLITAQNGGEARMRFPIKASSTGPCCFCNGYRQLRCNVGQSSKGVKVH
jgi:hypothetical protein